MKERINKLYKTTNKKKLSYKSFIFKFDLKNIQKSYFLYLHGILVLCTLLVLCMHVCLKWVIITGWWVCAIGWSCSRGWRSRFVSGCPASPPSQGAAQAAGEDGEDCIIHEALKTPNRATRQKSVLKHRAACNSLEKKIMSAYLI